ncbi:MAG: YbhB/YbcL family Raf kinase inhibitor-like protein [Rhodoferax sp.]
MFIGLGLMAALLAGCGGGSGGTDCAGSVNRCNVPPVAIASAAPTVLVGSTVSLDGSKSMDADGNPLTYSWAFVSMPEVSKTTIFNPTSAHPTFAPDIAGIYVISLTVNDTKTNGAPAIVTITASDTNLSITQAPFSAGSTIPLKFAATVVGGSNISPQLSIGDIPVGTDRFAIVMDDETAPCQPGLGACRHWGVFNLPVSKTLIGEGEDLLLQNGTLYGSNKNGTVGYLGPDATSQHTYKLTVYALAVTAPFLSYIPEYNRAKFEIDFKSYILGKATITGVYP